MVYDKEIYFFPYYCSNKPHVGEFYFKMGKKIFVANGLKIKQYRLLKGMTQQDLADQALLSVSVLSKIENGVHRNIRTGTLFNLAIALECDATEIITSFDSQKK